jgi:hypothetical protein
MLSSPRQLRLTGGDYFIHALDHQMRRAGMPGNNCRIVLHLERKPDTARLRQCLVSSPIFNWLGSARIVRALPIFAPLWRRAAQPAAIFQEHFSNGASHKEAAGLPEAVLERRLRTDRGPALALDLVCHADGFADLALSWNHALMDVHGAELLLRHLHDREATEETGGAPGWHNPEQAGMRLSRLWRGLGRRLMLARSSLGLINTVCREPLFTLLSASRPRAACSNHYRVVAFTSAETARVEAHCQRLNAEFRRSLFHLAATVQAVHALAARRGKATGAYLVPVPHDLRHRGATGPVLSNQLSFLFYRIESALAGGMSGTISELTRQMTEQIRNRHPECFLAAMEMFKIMPPGFYVHRLGRPTRGKFAAFYFSDAGETCAGIHDLFGAQITGVTHLAPASRPPGLTVVFWRFRRQLNVMLAWVDDCVSREEAEGLAQALRSALLGEETA